MIIPHEHIVINIIMNIPLQRVIQTNVSLSSSLGTFSGGLGTKPRGAAAHEARGAVAGTLTCRGTIVCSRSSNFDSALALVLGLCLRPHWLRLFFSFLFLYSFCLHVCSQVTVTSLSHPSFVSHRGLCDMGRVTSHKTAKNTCLGSGGWIPTAGVWVTGGWIHILGAWGKGSRGPCFFANTSFWLFQALFRLLGFLLPWLPASSYLAFGLTLPNGTWSLT